MVILTKAGIGALMRTQHRFGINVYMTILSIVIGFNNTIYILYINIFTHKFANVASSKDMTRN